MINEMYFFHVPFGNALSVKLLWNKYCEKRYSKTLIELNSLAGPTDAELTVGELHCKADRWAYRYGGASLQSRQVSIQVRNQSSRAAR